MTQDSYALVQEYMNKRLFGLSLLILLIPVPLSAQAFVLGGGLNGGSIPRAMAPLCNGARRLNGGGPAVRAGFLTDRVRVHATADWIQNVTGMSVAECLPGTGVSTDSAYAEADQSAVTVSAAAWTSVAGLDFGVETGWVPNHSAWFAGPGIGAQRGRLRGELIGRVHVISFEEVRRDYRTSPVREISRREQSELSWGLAARILVVTR